LTIAHLRNEYARALSGGQQKLLELGRLLMLDPQMIILDEPFAGVHPRLMEVIYRYITEINAQGKAFIIISHNMDTIFTLSRRLLVLNYGDLIADGEPEVVREDPVVKAAYLGEDEE
jgi:branched-chain amino acid transport system ATP-binding protein